ncbi:dicarboxylate/amino acid:cation symporter [Algicola sagamiensis]|uniref:dicarboxylate/amino acid:cation symporter n=1 Tax=Algicola sagamiensis TaxID=163869 RepID=UPI00058B274F|nr:dicarboxylate/amino acid:cation symporter [Algicola sagamiensis]
MNQELTRSMPKPTMSLTVKILIGMFLGAAIGLLYNLTFEHGAILQMFGADPANYTNVQSVINSALFEGILKIIAAVFVASLKLIVVPLVFVSLVCGICGLTDTSKLGRLGGKAVGLYLLTTAVAISIAVAAALVVMPGADVHVDVAKTTFAAKEAPSLVQTIIDMFPTNPVKAMAEGKMLQVIVFSILFGLAIALSGERGQRIANIFEDLNEVIIKLVRILMYLAPYGVFALVARVFSTVGLDAIAGIMKYFFLVIGVLFVHAFVVYPTILKTIAKLNPLVFLMKMKDAALFAFSTSSSGATMPVTMETATEKMGVRNTIASFTVPLGTTINMDGTAIMQGVATVFIAQAFNVDLTLTDYLMVVLTATLSSVGTAGVPGVGLIMLTMVLQQVNLPVEGIALIIGVDRLLDMTRTAVNVTGDCMVSCVVAKTEGELDEEVFYAAENGSSSAKTQAS